MVDALFVEEDAVVVLTTGVTAATRVATVLADTAVTSGHVAALLTGLLELGGLVEHMAMRSGHLPKSLLQRHPQRNEHSAATQHCT